MFLFFFNKRNAGIVGRNKKKPIHGEFDPGSG